jgi:MarC family membrane protein
MPVELIYYFVIFFVIIDPAGTAVIFAGLTHDWSTAQRREAAWRGIVVAAVLMLLFAVAGDPILHALGVSLAALRIAGGALLFLLATDMVFARPSGIHAPTAPEREEARKRDDVAVFPLGFPLLAGPGALTSVVLLMDRAATPAAVGKVLFALLVVLCLSLTALLQATRLARLLGATGAAVTGRVLGVVLAALAVQFVLDGLATSGFVIH